MRKALIGAGVLAAVLLAGIAAILMLVDVNQFRGPIQAELEHRLQRRVNLGNMGLRLFPLSVRIGGFNIAEAPQYASSRPFLTARELQVSAGLLALLRKRVEVKSLRLVEPALELIRNREGRWNYSSLGTSEDTSSQSSPAIQLETLEIQNGTVAITDFRGGKQRSVYDRIDAMLKNYAPGKHFSALIRAHFPGKGKQGVALTAEGTGGGTDLDGTLSLNEVSAGPVLLSGGGPLSARGKLITGRGTIKAVESRLKRPLDISYELQYDRESGRVTVAPITVTLGALKANGRADADTAASPMSIHAALRSENAPLPELLSLANAFGAAQGISGTGSISLDARVEANGSTVAYSGTATSGAASLSTPASRNPVRFEAATARLNSSNPPAGTIDAGKLSADPFVLTNVKSRFRLDNGILHLDDVTAGIFGGQIEGTVAVNTRSPQMSVATKAKLTQADASQLLAATSSVRNVSGSLSSNADLNVTPPPGQDPVRGLNGDVQLLLTSGRITGVHILNEMASLGKFIGMKGHAEPFTNISKLAGTLHLQNGLAQTNDLRMDFDGGSMAAAGTANLDDQNLNLKVTAVLGKETSQNAGGSQVGGFMSTVLANSKGELVIPAIVTGTFAKPHFAPDLERVGKMKFAGLVPTSDNPLTAAAKLQGLAGALTGKAQESDTTKPSPADKAKPYLDLLNSITKQPKQKAH
jgi:uncharacterized protein involved in outer membrane biogenesis